MIDDVLAMLAEKIYLTDIAQKRSEIIKVPKNQIFIMAHGFGSRWGDGGSHICSHKQLLPIGNRPLIVRTFEQIIKLANTDITVFAPHEFRQYFPDTIDVLSLPMRGIDSILTGIIFTEFLWRKASHLIFLLGDDIFEYKLLDRVLHLPCAMPTLFGRKGGNPVTGKPSIEFYALKVPNACREKFVTELFPLAFTNKNFKLFHLPDQMKHLHVDYWDGWTGDIDSYKEYKLYYKQLVELALKDDHEHLR